MTSKETNPKDMIGSRKAPMSTVSAPVMAELGVAMLEGAAKYGRHNYRAVGVRTSVYYDAALRHLFSFWEGEDIDPDSGMPHIVKAIASLTVLRDAQIQGKCVDDRAPSSREFYSALNARAAAILERYSDRNPRHYTIEDSRAAAEHEARELDARLIAASNTSAPLPGTPLSALCGSNDHAFGQAMREWMDAPQDQKPVPLHYAMFKAGQRTAQPKPPVADERAAFAEWWKSISPSNFDYTSALAGYLASASSPNAVGTREHLFAAACECLSPEQMDKFDALFDGDDDTCARFLRCILKRVPAGASPCS
ncbi:hypothetical protein BLA39750_02204 [Burkholderia lata]|uniref:dATP/dGTP diphosphohydrolase N-terminal domain-containing protein n=1 Tax=Burkholderia lata (strain ATCC 17760 / DSM 23089 / LMG 22485 / NCIMB 9086 / R18194 / 383) TaxID=482957 RepID=A0A6P2WKX9_BURL3|nr:dATP/dGTP diphosphohydrolase domain-containing protein [Burkholderia lata]VWC95663.1 hypothetical protein BLA39750_02204 [Burkholderia lata]